MTTLPAALLLAHGPAPLHVSGNRVLEDKGRPTLLAGRDDAPTPNFGAPVRAALAGP